MRYFRPTSLSWWSGAFLVAMGVLQAAGLPGAWVAGADGLTGVLQALTDALSTLTGAGEATPAVLIGTGLGIIGIRDAQAREQAAARGRFEAQMLAMSTPLEDIAFGFDEDDDESVAMPAGESPLPPGVRDPYGPGGSRE